MTERLSAGLSASCGGRTESESGEQGEEAEQQQPAYRVSQLTDLIESALGDSNGELDPGNG